MASVLPRGMQTKVWVTKRVTPQTFDCYGGLVSRKHTVHSASINNAERAVATRVLMYQEKDGSLSAKPQPVRAAVLKLGKAMLAATASAPHANPLSHASFMERVKGARKRQRMELAGSQVSSAGVERRDSEVKAFVKREAVKIGKPCRLIQARGDKYLYALARWLKAMEHPIYEAIDQFAGYSCVMKGYNGVERAQVVRGFWESFKAPVAVSLDFAKFDQHVSASVLECEHAVYKARNSDPELARLLNWQLVNRGRVVCDDGMVKYRVKGCRMSGDPNTSLGNIIICAAGHLEYARAKGIRCRVANDGDDSVIIVEEKDLERYLDGLDEHWNKLGFRLTVDSVTNVFSEIDFCQCRPVLVDGVWAFIRNPSVAVAKDLTCTQHLATSAERSAWLWCVGGGGLAEYSKVPIMGALYTELKKAGAKPKANYQWLANLDKVQRYRHTGLTGAGEVSQETRYYYWLSFGITPTEQLAMEEAIRAVPFTSEPIQIGDPPPILTDILLENNRYR